jgi:hypothetical protein
MNERILGISGQYHSQGRRGEQKSVKRKTEFGRMG